MGLCQVESSVLVLPRVRCQHSDKRTVDTDTCEGSTRLLVALDVFVMTLRFLRSHRSIYGLYSTIDTPYSIHKHLYTFQQDIWAHVLWSRVSIWGYFMSPKMHFTRSLTLFGEMIYHKRFEEELRLLSGYIESECFNLLLLYSNLELTTDGRTSHAKRRLPTSLSKNQDKRLNAKYDR